MIPTRAEVIREAKSYLDATLPGHVYDRMDGLTSIPLKKKVADCVTKIKMDLREDGFDSYEISDFVKSLTRKALSLSYLKDRVFMRAEGLTSLKAMKEFSAATRDIKDELLDDGFDEDAEVATFVSQMADGFMAGVKENTEVSDVVMEEGSKIKAPLLEGSLRMNRSARGV
jgi:hypothetical protein